MYLKRMCEYVYAHWPLSVVISIYGRRCRVKAAETMDGPCRIVAPRPKRDGPGDVGESRKKRRRKEKKKTDIYIYI